MSSFVTIDHIPEVIEQLHKAAGDIVAETAKEITETYAGSAAKDTGFMRSSAYTVTHEGSDYGQNLVGPDRELLPEVPKPEDNQTALSAVGATYAAYVEYGTVHMAAQPAFVPAVDKAQQSFTHKWSELDKRIHVGGGGNGD